VGRGQFPGSMLTWASGFDTRIELFFQAVLIRGRGRVILVNTGHDTDISSLQVLFQENLGTALERTAEHWIHTALARFGVTADEVTDLILTPLGPYSSARVQDFPNATIWLSEIGWLSFHTWHDHPHDGRETTISTESLAYLTGPAWPRVRLVSEPVEVVPGVRIWWTGGHHRATMCVDVVTDGQSIAISDIYFHLRNYTENRPIGMSENIYEVLAAYAEIRAREMIPLPMMDPANFVRYPDGLVCQRVTE
jgi:hypothetical protein